MFKRLLVFSVVLGFVGIACGDCPPGVLGYWQLDETSAGPVVDYLGANDGTNNGATIGVAGQVGTAYKFSSDGQDVNIPTFDLTTNWSISLWVKSGTITHVGAAKTMVLGNGDDANNYLWMRNGEELRFKADDGTKINWYSDADFFDRWRFVTLVAGTDTIKLYLDGVSQGDQAVNPAFKFHHIGSGYPTDSYDFYGTLDEVAVYDVALTATEVSDLYNKGLAHLGNCALSCEFTEASSSGDEDAGNIDFEVILSGGTTSGVITVDYTITNITAENADYSDLGTGTLTFNAGVYSQNVSINIIDDPDYEEDEQFKITLSNINGADDVVLGDIYEHIYTINVSDKPPYVQFAQSGSGGDEDVGTVNIEVMLSCPWIETVTVDYTIFNITSENEDYTDLGTGTLTFDIGVVSQNVSIAIVDDNEPEFSEQFKIALSNPDNALTGTTDEHIYTINGSDGGGGSAGDWPMWRYDARRTAATVIALPTTLYLEWMKELALPEPAWPISKKKLQFDTCYEPIVVGNMLYLPSMVTDSVTAYDTETGNEVWKYHTNGPVRFTPAAAIGKLYFGCDDGYVYCLDASDGDLLWKFRGGPSGRKIMGNDRLISAYLSIVLMPTAERSSGKALVMVQIILTINMQGWLSVSMLHKGNWLFQRITLLFPAVTVSLQGMTATQASFNIVSLENAIKVDKGAGAKTRYGRKRIPADTPFQ